MPSPSFVSGWHEAAVTSLGLFWMAFWAFGLGYLVSSLIQVLVSRERMTRSMGEADARSVALATGFGFVSSSCSFAALATTRALFAKGAGLVPALAFLLASTNLVVELGIVIGVFLGWQFVVGEYVGGVLLILGTWLLVRWTARFARVEDARERARDAEGDGADAAADDWRSVLGSVAGWRRIARHYVMEWGMVWKDVTVGFTVAGAIAVFVPSAFFHALFVGAGTEDPGALEVVTQAVVGPLAAVFTFIGSMGNVPLAAVLLGNGVSFAGVMAFLFSDLVVFPVLRIQARYYGWRMALYIAAVFLVVLVATSVLLHYAFAAVGWMPTDAGVQQMRDRTWFEPDYTMWLGMLFVAVTVLFVFWSRRGREGHDHDHDHDHGGGDGAGFGTWLMRAVVTASFLWLAVGVALPLFGVQG